MSIVSEGSNQLLCGIEAGGTKIICLLSRLDGVVVDEIRIPTGTAPEQTMAAVLAFLKQGEAKHGLVAAIGIGSFGPLSLRRTADDYGHITETAKPGWSGYDLLSPLLQEYDVPIALDTDVNCAAIAELLFGAGQDLQNLCYVTIGTGIGVGVIVDGSPFGGTNHLEAGHMLLRRVRNDDHFEGICAFHGDCAEGLAAGPAMQARWGIPAEELPPEHHGWDIEAEYVATICANLTYMLRPEKIILGGGVMEYPGIVQRVGGKFGEILAGYDRDACSKDPAVYITRPALGSKAGPRGALALAYQSLRGEWPRAWTERILTDT